jgi:creatinine amidohydrolase
MTWREARDLLALKPIGLLPTGAIEAHGPHLPLDTDVAIATAMAEQAALRLHQTGLPVLVLPAIAYGVSFAGTSFPGTSPADPDSYESYVGSVLRHLGRQGFRAICVCNAHLEPAHFDALSRSVAAAGTALDIPLLLPDKRAPKWAGTLSEEFQRGSRHAGSYETSLMLAIRPEQVRREYLEELQPVWVDLPAALRAGAKTFADAGGVDGYFGDPAAASTEEGWRLLDALATMIYETALEGLARR